MLIPAFCPLVASYDTRGMKRDGDHCILNLSSLRISNVWFFNADTKKKNSSSSSKAFTILYVFQLEVIGLNRQDYETRRLLLTLDIRTKEKMARHEVELKIDNLNVEDLLEEHK